MAKLKLTFLSLPLELRQAILLQASAVREIGVPLILAPVWTRDIAEVLAQERRLHDSIIALCKFAAIEEIRPDLVYLATILEGVASEFEAADREPLDFHSLWSLSLKDRCVQLPFDALLQSKWTAASVKIVGRFLEDESLPSPYLRWENLADWKSLPYFNYLRIVKTIELRSEIEKCAISSPS